MRPRPLVVVAAEAFLVEDVVLSQGSVVVVLPSMVIADEEVPEVSGEGDEGHLLYPYRLRTLFLHT